MRTVAIIQARMGSSRLPGKALLDLSSEPMLARVVTRTLRARTLNGVVVATTTESGDQAIVDFCDSRGWPCFRGSQEDVLDRYYQAARLHEVDVVVRITSDCPLIDPEVIDQSVNTFFARQPDVDYVYNGQPPRSFPRGLDTEVFHFHCLEQAWREAAEPAFREHVTPYLYRNPEKFRVEAVASDNDYSAMRWTVDTPEDRALVLRIYEHFGHDHFGWREVLDVLQQHPEWTAINRHIKQKTV